MKDTIYIICCRERVLSMRKKEPKPRELKAGEVVFKLRIEVDNEVFRPVILEQSVKVDNVATDGVGIAVPVTK